jgi:type II secretory pathway predicted ATPase ExeA/predicted Zn-dependent protease
MYLQHFHLTEKPFQISPDPRFLWLGEKHKEAFANLLYSMIDQNGFLVLTGDVGSGKTTLLNALLENIGDDVISAAISNPRMEVLEMLRYIARSFDDEARCENKTEFIIHMGRIFRRVEAQGKKLLLVIDEAHLLSGDQLEEIRLISNIESSQKKLITIILIGQNELNEKLSSDSCRALRQRITLYYQLLPFTSEETVQYINHRLRIAGTSETIFSSGALEEIYKQTGGLPRLINILCARALLTGYAKGMHTVNRAVIRECALELHLPDQRFHSLPVQPAAKPDKRKLNIAASVLVLLAIPALTLFGARVLTDKPTPQATELNSAAVEVRGYSPAAEQAAAAPGSVAAAQPGAGESGRVPSANGPGDRVPVVDSAPESAAAPPPKGEERPETALVFKRSSETAARTPAEGIVQDLPRSEALQKKTPVHKTAELPRPPAPSPDPEHAVVVLAQSALEKQNYRFAIETLEPYVARQAEVPGAVRQLYAQALTGQGRLHLTANRYKEAEASLTRAVVNAPDDFEAHFELGKLYTKTQAYAKAVQSYQRAISAKPDSAAGLYNLGFVYAGQKDYANAEKMLLRAVELETTFSDKILFNLAVVQLRLGKKADGIKNLKKSLGINPDNRRAREYLAKLGD